MAGDGIEGKGRLRKEGFLVYDQEDTEAACTTSARRKNRPRRGNELRIRLLLNRTRAMSSRRRCSGRT